MRCLGAIALTGHRYCACAMLSSTIRPVFSRRRLACGNFEFMPAVTKQSPYPYGDRYAWPWWHGRSVRRRLTPASTRGGWSVSIFSFVGGGLADGTKRRSGNCRERWILERPVSFGSNHDEARACSLSPFTIMLRDRPPIVHFFLPQTYLLGVPLPPLHEFRRRNESAKSQLLPTRLSEVHSVAGAQAALNDGGGAWEFAQRQPETCRRRRLMTSW